MSSTQVSDTTASTSAKTCCLTLRSSNTASMTTSASAKPSLRDRAGHQRLEPVGLVGVEAALGLQLVDLAVDVRHALVDARLVEVGEDHRHLEALHEQQRELAGHEPGADDADLGDRTGEGLVRRAGGALGAALHEVERVEPRAQVVAHDEVGERVVLGGEALVAGGRPGRGDEVERAARGRGRRRGAWRRRGRGPAATAASQASPRSTSGRSTTIVAGDDAGGPAQRLDEEVGRLEARRRASPSVERVGSGLSMRFWLSGFSTMTLTAFSAPTRLGTQVGAAPAGDEAEEDLGQAQRRRAGRERAVGAVQRDLEAAAHRRAVDERERRHGAARRGGARRRARASPSAAACGARRRAEATPVRSAPDGEDERLAGDGDGDDLAARPRPPRPWSSAAESERRPASPKVLGLVWSWPLSRVISAARPAPPGRSTRRSCACGDDLVGAPAGMVGGVSVHASLTRPCRRSAGSPR